MKRDALKSASTTIGQQPITLDVLREKYLKDGETSEQDIYRRVARALASVEPEADRALWEQRFFDNLQAGAIGAGRIMSAAGTAIQATLINCFVQPVGDCIQGLDDGGYPGIYEALREAAETMRRGGGVGYDFSRIRPRGAEVKTMASLASGPCSYINVFDHSCATVESAGARRGAQMGVLRIDHPDVIEFITAKRTPGRWNNFNVSVGVSDAFMRALADDQPWELVHRARPGPLLLAQGAHQRTDGLWVYRSLSARELWDTIMRSTYDFAEPGILFLDHIQQDNNLRYCETIEATNPCVTADTWVMTEDGPRTVADLVGQPFHAIVDGRSHAVQSEGFFATGHKPVWCLKTREGHSLRLTADHRVRRVARKTRYAMELDWTEATRLQPGDEIVLNNHRALQGWAGAGTRAEGYLLGLLIGDGTLKADKAVVSVWAPELRVVGQGAVAFAATGAAGIVQAAEVAAASLAHRADFRGFQRPLTGRGEARLSSAPLRDLALSLGMAPGNKWITPAMEQRSSDFAEGLLGGLFDADGSVQGAQEKGVSVRLSQSNEALLQTVQRMLLRLGIASTLYRERRPAWLRSLPDGRGGAADYATQAQHELLVSGDNLQVFAERIGFRDTGKAARLTQALSAYQRTPNRERFVATVESLQADGEETVFDVTVDDVHAFDANGLVVHNCGEQPLPPYGCCDLGPVILPRFVRRPFGFGGLPSFDFEAFEQAVALQVRALDNVLDVTFWPLPQQRDESAAKRRIGVGFTGMGNALAMLCVRYDRPEGRALAAQIAERMRDAAYTASVALAQEKGAFPKFDADGYLAEGTFASRLPEALRTAIRTHGIRNSHLLSIAPTGTVSLAFADNASNGIEPPFSWMYRRKKREADGSTTDYAVEDHAWRLFRELGGDMAYLPEYFVNALSMPATDHLAMMEAVQPFVDTAISKTVNVPADYPYDDFKGLYQQAWRAQLKGLATYRPNAILGSVLDIGPTPETTASVATVDPMRSVIESRPPGALSAVADKIEYWTQEGHQTLYLLVSFLPVPSADGAGTVERAIEFFMPVGQSGESQQWVSSSMRLLSLAARGGFLERALRDMRKVAWDRGPVRMGTHQKADGTHVPMWHDSVVAAIAYAVQTLIAQRAGVTPTGQPSPVVVEATPGMMPGKKCGECGAHAVIRKDGCDYCTQCGHLGVCG
ncbi:LAGLIDADG family homing endonuclease [Hydrogenophaga sp.]|uniref:LAGLIDADG family homing endonuclease n=1 Tax=Hydrogenophaga sp. TaxID=1904254 RepID=UPI002731D9FA|nr:LAGLIDADG family homing endonuclease [Hydrogenophaga sp.]MDP2018705.1 LAGLIDADG family homing endonuclease [Hydrogenophaga sp.]MDP3164507.1 LAGLIDADG family homing endonuclease [Hydrogenophaga sp.]